MWDWNSFMNPFHLSSPMIYILNVNNFAKHFLSVMQVLTWRMRQTTLYISTSTLKLSCYSSLGDWRSRCNQPCMPTSAPLPSESSAAKLEAGNLMSLHIDVSATDYSPYASSVRSDCILFMSDISRCCEDIILLQYDCRTIGRTASRLFVIVSEEASLLMRNIHGSYWGVLAGSRGPYVGHLYIYLNCSFRCLCSR
jgi:hypothetical protein